MADKLAANVGDYRAVSARTGLTARGAPNYRGVGTVCEAWPGIIIVLVPLPLFDSEPLAPEPGKTTLAVEPALPVTTPGPRGVITVCDPAPTAEDPVTPPEEEVCASAALVDTARATVAVSQKPIMS